MRIGLISLLVVAASTGCSTVPTGNPVFTDLEAAGASEAIVYVFRPKSFTGGGIRYDVRLSDQWAVTLPNCGFSHARVPPGDYILSAKAPTSASAAPAPITVSLRAGERHFYLADIDGSFTIMPAGPTVVGYGTATAAWRRTDEVEAVKLMTGCHRVDPA